MKIIDISMEINENMLTYPKNPKPMIKRYAIIPQNKTNESIISIGSHSGTHIDSQLHIRNGGNASDKLPLGSFYGKCRILDLTDVGNEIRREHLESFDIEAGEIILLKTENSKHQYNKFRQNFAHLKYDGAEHLVRKKIKTLGVDYLSVKKFGGDDEVHEIIINNLTLFEGLYLKNVEPGSYIFIGLPLKIKCDGAPARAILVKN
jgi:arylformamidase